MGVYSNLAVQKINEQQMLENFQFSNLIEFAIDIEKSDQAMFDAMLEMDFHEAYEAKGIITLTENEKLDAVKAAGKAIWNKIVAVLEKISGIIKTFVAKIKNVFAELSKKNEMLYNRIGEINFKELNTAVTEENSVEVTIFDNSDKKNTFIYEKTDAVRGLMKDALGGKDAGEVKSAVKDITGTLYNQMNDRFIKVDLKEAITKKQIMLKDLAGNVKNPQWDSNVEATINKLQSDIDAEIDKAKTKLKEDKEKEDRVADNNILTGLHACAGAAVKVLGFIKGYYARKSAVERALYVKCGTYLEKGLSKEDKKELRQNVKDAAKDAVKSAPGKAVNAVKSKLTKEAAEYECMAIDVMNESYMEQIFA